MADNGYVARLEVSTDDVTYVDVTPWVDGELTRDRDENDISSHQSDGDREWLAGHRSAELSFTLIRDPDQTVQDTLENNYSGAAGTNLYFHVYPTEVSGDPYYQCQGFVKNWSTPFNRDDVQMVNGSIRITGAMTKATIP